MKLERIVFFILLSGCASQPQIGAIIHPSLGEFGSTGICIGGANEPCAFSVSVFERRAVPQFVVALKFVERDAEGKPLWKIVDKVALPTDMANKFVRYDACRNNESPNDAVVAVVRNYDRGAPEFVSAAGWAYKVDLPSGKLVAINADAVECLAQVGED